jgi:hypothetical protein
MSNDETSDLEALPSWLWLQPAGAFEPPVVTQLLTLDFTKITWSDFERLTLEVATSVDGLRSPRLYGNPGQSQDGIDFYGQIGKRNMCYQARRLEGNPSPELLTNAVADFKARGAKFSASRFVLCLAGSGRSTAVQDELNKLRQANPDLDLDLYDSELLSQVLKVRRDIVHRYFGPAWADAFCGPLPPAVSIADQPPDRADALLRGPMATLGLESELRAAEDATADPRASAAAYARLAAAAATTFPGLAPQMKLREADAWMRAGDPEMAISVWMQVAVEQIDRGTMAAELAIGRLRDQKAGLTAVDGAVFGALEAKVKYYLGGVSGAIATLAPSLDQLRTSGSGRAAMVGLWLGEMAVAEADHKVIEAASQPLAQLANQVRAVDEDLHVRLELILAEASGDWTSLVSRASTGRISPANCGLVFVRQGRWLANRAQPDAAVDSFLQSIAPHSRAGWLGDAAEALYSIVDILHEYGPDEQWGQYFERARLVKDQPRRFVGDRDYHAGALSSLHEEHFAEAHRLIRRLLWQAVVAGHTTDERRARNLLGDLYARSGDHGPALANYVLAGQAKEAAQQVEAIGSYVEIPLATEPGRPWVLASQLKALEAEADLVPEAVARALFPSLMKAAQGVRQGWTGPNVSSQAVDALGAIALQLSNDQLRELIGMLAPLIPRDPATWRPSDKATLHVFSAAWHRYPELRDELRPLLSAILGQSNIGQESLSLMANLTSRDDDLRQAVVARAEEGCLEAVIVLALIQVDHPSVIEDADRRYTAALAAKPRTEGDPLMGFGAHFELLAAYASRLSPDRQTRLARHVLRFAQAATEPEVNRSSAVAAIGLMARHMPDGTRADMFREVLNMASDDAVPSDFDQLAASTQHLLSMFRMNLPAGIVPQTALIAACRLSWGQQTAAQLAPLLLEKLTARDPEDIVNALHAWSAMEAEFRPQLDARAWTEHVDARVRHAAVSVSAVDPLAAPTVASALAGDPNVNVRSALAAVLSQMEALSDPVLIEATQQLHADQSAHVRTVAASIRIDAGQVRQPARRSDTRPRSRR